MKQTRDRKLDEVLYTIDNDRITLPAEFKDFYKVLEFGASMYEVDNWLDKDGKKSDFSQMHISLIHHAVQSFAAKYSAECSLDDMIKATCAGFKRGIEDGRPDHESGLDSLLHAIARAQMVYTKLKKGHYDGESDKKDVR